MKIKTTLSQELELLAIDRGQAAAEHKVAGQKADMVMAAVERQMRRWDDHYACHSPRYYRDGSPIYSSIVEIGEARDSFARSLYEADIASYNAYRCLSLLSSYD